MRALFDNKDDSLFEPIREYTVTGQDLGRCDFDSDVGDPHNGQTAFVYVIQNDTAQIRISRRSGRWGNTAVEGINPGDVVANSSFEKLQNNSKIVVSKKRSSVEHERGAGNVSLSPSRPFIMRPVATALLMAAIMLVGIVAYTQLPVSALPEVDYPTIQVVTFYPGAKPVGNGDDRNRTSRTAIRTTARA